MPVSIESVARLVAVAFEAGAIAAITLGTLAAVASCLRTVISSAADATVWPTLRRRLGRSILFGLELLVAADIVGMIAVSPSLEGLAILGLIVLIRTFLSFAVETEIEGRWPWRRPSAIAGRD